MYELGTIGIDVASSAQSKRAGEGTGLWGGEAGAGRHVTATVGGVDDERGGVERGR
jgi:hypothetical protein